MSAEGSGWQAESRKVFADVRDPARRSAAVVTFHRRLDEVLAESVQAHGAAIACRRGCHYCCYLNVEVQPAEAFTLAAWIKRRFAAPQLAELIARLRENVARACAFGAEAIRRTNLRCALLSEDGTCSAYDARPAQCRKFHSTRLATCEASYANPADDSIESPEHPAVAHNAAVIVALARRAVRDAGFDESTGDLQASLLEALENPKAERRWRDGKKAFV